MPGTVLEPPSIIMMKTDIRGLIEESEGQTIQQGQCRRSSVTGTLDLAWKDGVYTLEMSCLVLLCLASPLGWGASKPDRQPSTERVSSPGAVPPLADVLFRLEAH